MVQEGFSAHMWNWKLFNNIEYTRHFSVLLWTTLVMSFNRTNFCTALIRKVMLWCDLQHVCTGKCVLYSHENHQKKGCDIVSYLTKFMARLLITILVNVLVTSAAAAIILLYQPAEMTETSCHRFIVVSAFTQRRILKCLRLWV